MFQARLERAASAALVAGVLAVGFAGGTQEPGDARLVSRLDKLVRETVEREAIPGLAVVVGVGSDVLFAKGWGFIDDGYRRPVEPTTAFRVGALSDQWIDAAVLRLVDAGKLSLDAKVDEILPGWDWGDETVTLDNLLSHTSGIPDFTLLSGAGPSEAAILERLRGEGLEFTPGKCFSYSPSNALLLGAILEKVSGQKVSDYLTATFFEPLELEATGYSDPPPAEPAAGASEEVAGEPAYPGRGHAVFGGERLSASALDLFHWQRALVRGDIVSAGLLERMVSERYLPDGGRSPHGYGYNQTPLDTVSGVSHGGSLSGYTAHVAWYPEPDVTIVVLAVGDDVDAAGLERRMARLVLDLPAPGIQDLDLSADERAVYTGVYMIGCNRLEVRDEDERIVLYMLDHPALPLLYQGRHLFVARGDETLRVTFIVADGPATAFVLDEGGIHSWATRVE